jgi:hypothetical protein
LRLTAWKTANVGANQTLDSPALPATIPISLWSTIPQPTIHAVCNVTSTSQAQKEPPITLARPAP